MLLSAGRIVRSAGARSTDVRGVAPFPNLVTSLLPNAHEGRLAATVISGQGYFISGVDTQVEV